MWRQIRVQYLNITTIASLISSILSENSSAYLAFQTQPRNHEHFLINFFTMWYKFRSIWRHLCDSKFNSLPSREVIGLYLHTPKLCCQHSLYEYDMPSIDKNILKVFQLNPEFSCNKERDRWNPNNTQKSKQTELTLLPEELAQRPTTEQAYIFLYKCSTVSNVQPVLSLFVPSLLRLVNL